MKNKLLLSLIVSLFAVSAAWADTSVVERFSQVGEILNNDVSKTEIRTVNGDLCQWEHRGNRRDTTTDGFSDKMASGKLGWWTSGNNSDNLLRTKDAFEGGVKQIDLEWKQFSTAAGATVVVDVIVGATTFHPINYTGGNASTTVATTDQHASFDCNIKQNAQINVTNLSTTTSKAGRILIGDITITPYLLYTQKKVVVGLSQTGYINNGLIDNTEGEGTISYSSSNESVATVNAGVIEPKAVGKTIITATWEGVTTSYELIVANMVAETFSGVTQGSSSGSAGSNWVGDICRWSTKFARRGASDLINNEQASWLTLDGTTRGFLKTTNLEGGLLGVAFDYAQFGTETGKVLIWEVSDGTSTGSVSRDGDLGANKNDPAAYSYVFENKENVQLEILNASIMDNGTQPTGNARLLIHNIKIAPYLLYTTKEAALDTRIATTYTHPIINNTALEPGTDVVYSISSAEGLAGFNTATGEVTATESTQGNYTITATWGDVSTSYELAITSRNETSASFDGAAIVNLGLSDAAPTKTLTYTAGYDGTSEDITYSSNNTEVATVANDGTISLAGGVGQAIITAHLAQTANYKAAEASYIIQVTDDGANIQEETFSAVPNGNAAAHTNKTWNGDLFDWHTTEYGGVRKNGDKFPSDNTEAHTGIWMGIPDVTSNYATLQSKQAVEGGIKHMSFYWEQWGTESEHILNPVVYIKTGDNEPVQKASVEYTPTGSPVATNRMLIGINNIQSNSQLIIRNESHKSDGSRDNGKGRIILDEIHITPYLLYTNKAGELDMRTSATTYKNDDLINNTGTTPTYSISPTGSGASIDNTGLVTAEDGTQGDFTITASWGDVSTSYVLTIISRNETSASYPNANVHIALGGTVNNTLEYTENYDGTIAYASSNTAVATVANDGTVTLAGGVGQTTITATLPQTTNYKAASASYNLYVRNNGARIEMFSGVSQSSVVGETLTDWNGDLFTWQAQYQVRRGTNDTIHAGITKHQGTSIGIQDPTGTPLSSILQSKGDVEGGIKYLTFYWMQWGAASGGTRRIAVYADDELIGYQENPNGASGKTGDEFMLGINNAMKSNKQLIIKNESYKGSVGTLSDASNSSRIVLDNIYITPYLRYTLKEATLDMRNATTYTNTNLINNTGGNNITYTLENPSVEEMATIDSESGEVTGLKAGQVTVKATWNEVGTGAYVTYTLNIVAATATEASFEDAIVHIGLNGSVSNSLNITEGYEDELASESKSITYTSSNPAVASYSAGVWTVNGVGQTTISASLPATENFTAAEASYILQVTDNSARKEAFSSISNYKVSDIATNPIWNGDLFDWHVAYSVRRNNDMFPSDNTKQGTWMGIPDPSSDYGTLQSEEVIEGGIKYLSFYFEQPNANESGRTLKPAVYVKSNETETLKGSMEVEGKAGAQASETRSLLGINNVMKSNSQLVIKNESYTTAGGTRSANTGRILLDEIHITPYLLFADKAERVMRIGDTDKNESLINNTGADATFISSNPDVASVAYDGTVTAKARGKVIITAKYQWNEEEVVTTTYPVAVYPVNCETFSNEATASSYAANEESAAGDKATWRARLAGINVGDFEPNVAFIRAPRQGEDKEAYLESSAIAGGIASMTFDWNLVASEAKTNWDIRILINGREVKRLGNSDLAVAEQDKMENFAQITIPAINEPDNFTIRFENHSTINGTYTSGNKARFVIDNICWENYSGTKTLAEDDATNESWIRANGGETRNVIISRSTMVANVWNTLCLPFDLEQSALGDGVDVQEMTNASLDGENLTITFSAHSGALEAGTPYLVKPTNAINLSGEYADKEITGEATAVEFGGVKLQGTFSPVAVTANDYNTLFVGNEDGEGNNLFYPSVNGHLRGLRAHFKIVTSTPMSAPFRRARFVVNQKDVETGMESVLNSEISNQKIIRDGQLFIIRGDKMYNAQGQVIK